MQSERGHTLSLDRFQGALLCGATGDALSWPAEYGYVWRGRQTFYTLPIEGFVTWRKFYGGWSGYEEVIEPGEYSDDTQLTLAVARSTNGAGAFVPEHFAYGELPLWLQYQRGGGQALKTAARALLQTQG